MNHTAIRRWQWSAIKAEWLAVVGMLFMVSLCPIDVRAGSPTDESRVDGKYDGKQGEILVVEIPSEAPSAQVQGTFLGRPVNFFPDPRTDGATGFVGLLGIDMQEKPGTHELTVRVTEGDRTRSLRYHVEVQKEKFHVEHLKLPKNKVDLDPKALARWKAEQRQVKQALASDSPMRIWQASFVEPVNGRRTGKFGSVRIMNGKARNPHSGEDIGAPNGTDVLATNDGVVRLTVDHIFSGKGVFLDHGLGFYSMYFHLSKVSVKEGDTVRAGEVVGKVGATGRATGPHLHWGVKLNGARVNPYAVLDLPFKDMTQASSTSTPADSLSAAGAPSP